MSDDLKRKDKLDNKDNLDDRPQQYNDQHQQVNWDTQYTQNDSGAQYTHESWDPNEINRPQPYSQGRNPLDSATFNQNQGADQQGGAQGVPTQGRQNQGIYQDGGFQEGGYQDGRFQEGGYQQGGHQQGGYQQGGYQQGNFQQGGYQQGGYQHGGYQQGNYNRGNYHYRNYPQNNRGGNYPPNIGGYQAGGPQGPGPAFVTNQRKDKPSNTIFAVLLAVLLTAIFTTTVVYNLSRMGVLPGTEQNVQSLPTDENGEIIHDIDSLGISVHTNDPEVEDSANKLAEVIQVLQDNYYSVLSHEEILDAMSKGLLDAIDNEYTHYLTIEEVANFNQSVAGNYSGIGATVRAENTGEYTVSEVYKNSPAEQAGLEKGDIITEVDGTDTADFETVQDLSDQVKGLKGTDVVLTVLRGEEELEISITRDDVVLQVVHTRVLEDNIGYMYISSFTQTLPSQFEEGIKELMAQGVTDIVFDLRNNSGGSANALIQVVDMLLDEAEIATVRGRTGGESYTEVWTSEEGKLVPEAVDFAVLVNGNSASASELFSGSLKDNDRAVLIGSQTFGKGSGTRTYNLSDGSAANITIFNYFLPESGLIEGIGIAPDIESEGPDPEVIRTKNFYELEISEDPDLAKAIEYFEGE